MLYSILKIIVRLTMMIFCREIIVNNRAVLKKKGPLLLASNHPNSFLDAIILDILFEQPIWSLARGDVFKNSLISKILRALKMFPVYRTSEGVENLNSNYETFKACKELFRKKGIVLIFSEGLCVNEWHLRTLKKGTARLAIYSWENNIPLEVLPVGINYSSFRRFGKNVLINFGNIISVNHIPEHASDGLRYQAFNNKLSQELNTLVFEIDKTDHTKKKELLTKKPGFITTLLCTIPAVFGWLFHLPVYIPIQKIIFEKTKRTGHYDSVLAAVLLFVYPVYLMLVSILFFYFTGTYYSFLLLLLLPFTAWCFVQVKGQMD